MKTNVVTFTLKLHPRQPGKPHAITGDFTLHNHPAEPIPLCDFVEALAQTLGKDGYLDFITADRVSLSVARVKAPKQRRTAR